MLPVKDDRNSGFSFPFDHNVVILVVDDEADVRQSITAILATQSYRIVSAGTAREAVAILRHTPVDLLITDVRLPDQNGMKLVTSLHPRQADMEILMVTAVTDLDLVTHAMREGVYDYIVKPFEVNRLVTSVRHALERQRLARELKAHQDHLEYQVESRTAELKETVSRLETTYRQTLFALGAALETRDWETEAHAFRVMLYGKTLVAKVNPPGLNIRATEFGLYLHDIGKIGIPDSILKKKGTLTPEEWVEMKRHPDIGRRLLETIDFFKDAKDIVYNHHERWNGSGYPRGLKGYDIPWGARAFSIIDAFDAMTSDRPYRQALPMEYAMKEIQQLSGIQFDPDLVQYFLDIPPETWLHCRFQALTIGHSCEQKRNGLLSTVPSHPPGIC